MSIQQSVVLVAVVGILAAGGFIFLLNSDPTSGFERHVPGMDGTSGNDGADVREKPVNIGEHFEKLTGNAADLPGAWPTFRGPDLDNINKESIKLAGSWGEGGPKMLWSIQLGEGHSAPAVIKGRVFLLDYDEEKRADMLRCFSLADGQEIWRRWYEVRIKRNHGMSRTIPAVTDKWVITIGPKCHVMCVDMESGDFKWGIDLVKDYGTEVPGWYTGQCPLIDGQQVIIAPGGKDVLMMGVDCETGNVLWKTPNPERWQMSHSSIMPMTLGGRKMYVYAGVGGLVGVAADGDTPGTVLWQTNEWTASVIAPSPLIIPGGLIIMTASYGKGAVILQIKEEGGTFSASVVDVLTPKNGVASEQQTPIFHDGKVYVVLPKDAGALRRELAVFDPKDCRAPLWTSGKTERFGLGPYLIADNKLFILDDDGVLTVLDAVANEYKQLGRAKILNGVDSWGPMALVGGRLLVRDSRQLACVDIRAVE